MDTNELLQKIKEYNITPFLLYNQVDDSDNINDINSDLEDFLVNLNKINVVSVSIKRLFVEKEDFFYDNTLSSIFLEDSVAYGQNKILEKLSIYGDTYPIHQICFTYNNEKYTYQIIDDWYDEFVAIKEMVSLCIKDFLEQKKCNINIVVKEKFDKILEKIDRLIDDENFCKLPTQRSMISYVMDNFPEIRQQVPFPYIKERLQLIHGRVDAKTKSRKTINKNTL